MPPVRNFLLLLLFLCFVVIATPIVGYFNKSSHYTASIKTFFYPLGQRKLTVSMHQYGDVKDVVFISLHDDEKTSVEATKVLLEKKGGLLIKIENNGKRNIKFKIGSSFFEFDPNRMFSQKGIRGTLEFHHKKVNEKAVSEIEKLGQWLVGLMPEKPKCVIALHNNTNGNFSINDYLPGNGRSEAAAKVYIARYQDPDDLFLTTEEEIYNTMVDAEYNILLQDNTNAKEDGSLSIYCGKNNISYVNCETEHGKLNQYKEMMEKLLGALNGRSQENEYNFVVEAEASLGSETSTKIYFNEKEVGYVKMGLTNESKNQQHGKIFIKKGFAVYSNTDFFLLQDQDTNKYIEIRIDPTREQKPINTTNNTIKLIVKNKELGTDLTSSKGF